MNHSLLSLVGTIDWSTRILHTQQWFSGFRVKQGFPRAWTDSWCLFWELPLRIIRWYVLPPWASIHFQQHLAQQNMKDRSYLATFSPCTLRKEVTFRAIMSCEHNKSCNPFCCISTTITQNPLRGQGGATFKLPS